MALLGIGLRKWFPSARERLDEAPKKMGSERPKVDILYVDVRVQLCEVVDALVVVVLCWDIPVLDVPLIAANALPRT